MSKTMSKAPLPCEFDRGKVRELMISRKWEIHDLVVAISELGGRIGENTIRAWFSHAIPSVERAALLARALEVPLEKVIRWKKEAEQ